MNPASLTYTDSYHTLLQRAAHYSQDGLLRTKDIFYAAVELCSNDLVELVGKSHIIFPQLHNPKKKKVRTHNKSVTYTAEVDQLLSPFGGALSIIANPLNSEIPVDAFYVCAALLSHPCKTVKNFLSVNGINVDSIQWVMQLQSKIEAHTATLQQQLCQQRFKKEIHYWKKVRSHLASTCYGQQSAIYTTTAQIAAFRAQPSKKPLIFFFYGEQGTGKTLLAENIRRAVAEINGKTPTETLDLTRFSNESIAQDIIGQDCSWRGGGKKGKLPEMVQHDPKGVLVFDNVHAAHYNALNHILAAISTGKVKDDYTGETYSLKENIIVLCSNLGAEYLNTNKVMQLLQDNGGGVLPREKSIEAILDAFSKTNTMASGPLSGLVNMCDYPILFAKHNCASTQEIIRSALEQALKRVEKTFNVTTEIDTEAFTRFMLETIPTFGSAHGIYSKVEDIIATSLQHKCIDFGYVEGDEKIVHYQIDDLPELEGYKDSSSTTTPLETLQARTSARCASAKYLEYTTEVTFTPKSISVHISDLSYQTMPAIEDLDWFSVRPSNTKWEDLVGVELPRQHIQRVLAYFNGEDNGFLMPETGLLLYGGPGCGKTSVAKAVANELKRPFIGVCGADFATPDNSAIYRVHELFNVARRTKAVIFIDEVDAIGNRTSATGTQAAIINAILAELDGVEQEKPLVIAATNRPQALDEALLRPGRLNCLIELGNLKKASDRRKLVDILTRKAGKHLSEELYQLIVEVSYDWSPAKIQAVLREMFYLAGANEPTRKHFIAAARMSDEGKTTQAVSLSEEDMRIISVHEAGHALLASYHNKKWIQVSLKNNSTTTTVGELELSPRMGCLTAQDLYAHIDIALAGHAAEVVMGCVTTGSTGDFKLATAYACQYIRAGFSEDGIIAIAPDNNMKALEWTELQPRASEILNKRLAIVVKYLGKNKRLLVATAKKLFEQGVLFADELPTHVR